jgi:hypothetical protein
MLPACYSHQDGGRRTVGGRPKSCHAWQFSPSEDFRMKKFVVTLLVGAFALTVCLGSAQARPAYPNIIKEYYKDNKAIVEKAGATDKCIICHDAKDKKIRNEYGKAVNKNLKKEDFDKLKGDAEGLKKKVGEALKAAESEKNSAGTTFGEIIKAGKLPGEK